MVMERKELEKIFTHFQARSRGYLLRKEVRRARADFEALVMEIDGTLNHLQWREDGVVSMAHFTDTDGPFPRHTSSSSAPPHGLGCPETTRAPGHRAEKTDRRRRQRVPEKTEAEKDAGFLHNRQEEQQRQAGHSRCHHQDRSESPGDSTATTTSSSTATTVWSSVELDTGFTPSHRGPPQRHRLAQDVPRNPEALRLHRNALSMELLWLQQAIASRKKYLSLKQRLSAS